MCIPRFVYPFIHWWTFDWFPLFCCKRCWLWIVNSVTVNIPIQVCICQVIESYGNSVFSFLWNHQTVSMTAEPFYTAHSNVPCFCFCDYNEPHGYKVVPHCDYDFFSLWIMMLTIFLCACQPFVYLHINVYWSLFKSFAHFIIWLFFGEYCWQL